MKHVLAELLKDSVLVTGLVTLAMVGTMCGMMIFGRELPKEFWLAMGGVMGYWFSKSPAASLQRAMKANRKEEEV
jgi:hypothetical protein